MQNENLDSAANGIMTAERNSTTSLSNDKGMFEKSGHRLAIEGIYKGITTYEWFIPCECGAARDGQAATQSCQQPFSVSKVCHSLKEDGINWEWGKPEYTRRYPAKSKTKINCQLCYQKALQNQQDWEFCSEREEQIEGSHKLRCCWKEID